MRLSALSSALSLFGFATSPPSQDRFQPHVANTPQPLTFQLRHLHGVMDDSKIIFHDVPEEFSAASTHSVTTRRTTVPRPKLQADFHRARRRARTEGILETLDWEEDEIVAPDATNRETLLELAKMTNNAYLEPGDDGWYNLTDNWNKVSNLMLRNTVILNITHRCTTVRALRLAGSLMPTGFAVTSSCPPTNPL